jgi:hypothetical protein
MMAVLKEYVCLAHGDFEGYAPKCPQGCGEGMVQRAFRTPVRVNSAGYANMNKTFESLAAEHGLSNMSNASGQQRRADWQAHKRLQQANELIVQSGDRRGTDVSSVFQPLSNFQMGSTGGGALTKENGRTVNSMGVALNAPTPNLVARPHDGTKAGLPQGDA